jgi:pilus assembly protein CpaB
VRSRLLAITLAVVLAVVGVVGVLGYVRHANDRAVNGLRAETVLVASQGIQAGTSLMKAKSEDWLTTEDVPDSSVTSPVPSVTATNEREVFSGTVAKGQVVLKNMLAPAGTFTGPNSAVLPLPQGDIGVTMELCLDADVAGYVQPGSYIAVFDTAAKGAAISYTCTSHQSPTNGAMTSTYDIVPRVEVLSVIAAGSASTSSTSGETVDGSTTPASGVSSAGEVLVTLAATSQQEAEALITITNAGYPAFGLLTKTAHTYFDLPPSDSLQS